MAEVCVNGARGVLTDRRGRFALPQLPGDSAVVEVRFIGYRTWVRTVDLREAPHPFITVLLNPQPVPIEGITVEGVKDQSLLERRGFYERRSRGLGHFLAPDEVDAARPHVVTDILRAVPGVSVTPVHGPYGVHYELEIGRTTWTSGFRCPVAYFVDGHAFEPSYLGIDRDVRAAEIEAIEVYKGASQIPPEFNSSLDASACGVVVIWTRLSHAPAVRDP